MSVASIPQPPKRLLEEFYRGFTDHDRFCRECLTIRDRQGHTVALDPWPAHRRLTEAIHRQRKRGQPVRIVYLKPRRVSVSVGATAHLFHAVPFLSGQHAFVVSYVNRSSEEIFQYIEQYVTGYKPYQGVIRLPALKAGTRGSKSKIEWDNGSYIEVQTAKNVNTGRSFDVRHVLLDEFAHCENASKLMTSLLPSVPEDLDTTVIVASTANGIGGSFFELWQKASDKSIDSGWQAVFFAWWEHPAYRRALDISAQDFQRSLSRNNPLYGDEFAEREKYNLDLEQLNWRRQAISGPLCSGSLATFNQEFPGEASVAFLSSGRPRFDQVALGRMPIVQNGLTGELTVVTVGTRERVIFNPREDGFGRLTVYRRPEPLGEYVLGADPSQGIDVRDGTAGNSDPDYSVASVLDRRTGEQVARFRSRVQPAAFADIVYALGWFYNWAYTVPEAVGSGLGTIEKLLELQYPLERIHKRRAAADVSGSTLLQYYGYETNTVTRPQLVSALDDAIRELSILIRDPNTLQECRSFVIKPNGRVEHAAECHDDEVLALALAVIGLRFAPRGKSAEPVKDPTKPRPVFYGRRRLRDEDGD